jgi:hypothetical protein
MVVVYAMRGTSGERDYSSISRYDMLCVPTNTLLLANQDTPTKICVSLNRRHIATRKHVTNSCSGVTQALHSTTATS